jgi:hypothetical protein
MRPPQRLIAGAPARIASPVRSCAAASRSASVNIKTTSAAAARKASRAERKPAKASACPVRPTRIGPLQPKPANR